MFFMKKKVYALIFDKNSLRVCENSSSKRVGVKPTPDDDSDQPLGYFVVQQDDSRAVIPGSVP